jgi:hypothetical protein
VTRYEIELTDEQAWAITELWSHNVPHSARPEAQAYHDALFSLADEIRNYPPKRPRMAEPDWGEMVIASAYYNLTRRPFVKFLRSTDPRAGVWHDGYSAHPPLAWHELIDPEPVP